jgi:hypothetical protein
MESSYHVKLTANWLAGTDAVGPSEINTIESLMSELNLEEPLHIITEVGPRPEHPGGGRLVAEFLDIAIVMPIAVFLTAFAKSFGSKLGEKSGEAVSKEFGAWLKRAHEGWPHHKRVTIVDEKEKIIVHLPKNLPPEAYDQLVKVANEIPKRRFRRKHIILVYHWPNELGGPGWR